jgi:hypothetical protein
MPIMRAYVNGQHPRKGVVQGALMSMNSASGFRSVGAGHY